MKTRMMLGVLFLVSIVVGQTPQQLTDQDKTEIQALVTGYAKALRSCAANDYADLFGESGYFASGFRGHVAGRGRLIAMVQSERQCINATPATQTSPVSGPTVVLNVTPGGVY